MEEQGGHHAWPLPARPQQRQPKGRRCHGGDEVEVEVEIATEPRAVVEPADFACALNADPAAGAAYDRLSYSRKREHVLAIESAKKAETRQRLIEKALSMLGDQASAGPFGGGF
jgi:hypothetical protein